MTAKPANGIILVMVFIPLKSVMALYRSLMSQVEGRLFKFSKMITAFEGLINYIFDWHTFCF